MSQQLTAAQQQSLMAQAQMEANQKLMQDMVESMVKSCGEKCLGTSGDKLDSREQACLGYCQDLYLESRMQVQQALVKRQGGM